MVVKYPKLCVTVEPVLLAFPKLCMVKSELSHMHYLLSREAL